MSLTEPALAAADAADLAAEAAAAASAHRHSPARSVARGALALLSTQPLTWSATLLVLVFAPRYLGYQGYGQWALATNIASLVGVVALWGLGSYLKRCIAVEPRRAVTLASTGLLLTGSLAVLLAIGCGVAARWLDMPIAQGSLLSLALAQMVLTTVLQVLQAVLLGQERTAVYAWLNACCAAAIGYLGVAILVAGGDVQAYLASALVPTGLAIVIAWRALRLRLAPDRDLFAPLLRGGLPFLLTEGVWRIRNQADIVLTGLLLSEQAAGWLAASYRVISIPTFIPTALTTPLLPALSRSAHDAATFASTLRRSIEFALLLTMPVAALIIACAPAIPRLLGWGEGFQHAVPLMSILALQQPLMATDMLLGTALVASHRERRSLGLAVCGATFNVAMNLWMIPLTQTHLGNGAIGAAMVEVVTEALLCIGAVLLLGRGPLSWSLVGIAARIGVACLCLGAVIMVLRETSLPLAVVAGGLIYLVCAVALGVLRPRELWQIRRFVFNRH